MGVSWVASWLEWPQAKNSMSHASQKILKLFRVLAALVAVLGGIALIRDTAYNGHDFEVFWNAARALLQGSLPYEVGADSGMVFKYPPWILPFFVPFAFFDLATAKWLWGVIEVAALGSVGVWVWRSLKQGASEGAGVSVLGVGLCFWGLWAVHALDGQVALPILALLLWNFPPGKSQGASHARMAWVLMLLTTKVFTIFAALGLLRRLRVRTIFLAILFCGVMSAPALFIYSQKSSTNSATTPAAFALVQGWTQAASSGVDRLGLEHVRGRANQGLPGLVLRNLSLGQLSESDTRTEVILFAVLTLILGGWWWRQTGRRQLGPEQSWAGWLALAPVVHPLPWWHLFVWAYPLAVFAFAAAMGAKSGHKRNLALVGACLGIFLLCFATEKVMGPLGASLEVLSVKSWGVLILAFVMSQCAKRTEKLL